MITDRALINWLLTLLIMFSRRETEQESKKIISDMVVDSSDRSPLCLQNNYNLYSQGELDSDLKSPMNPS